MPYKRRYNRRYKRRRPGRLQIYKNAGSQLWRDVMWLKSVINVEKKYVDSSVSVAPDTTGGVQLLNGMTLGDTGTTRDGQSVKFIQITYKGALTINSSATYTFVRLGFFLDRQPNAGTTTINNVYNAVTPNALRVIGTGYRYKVIKDMQFALSSQNKQNVYFEKTIKLRFHTRYNTNNAGTVADIITNALYCFYLSDQATNTPTLSMQVRLRFIDN